LPRWPVAALPLPIRQLTLWTTDTGHSRCEAKAAEFTMGKTASAELLEQARKRAGAQNARFLSPNDMVTLEYRSDRLNLSTDANKVVTRVNCG
jgi:hypothetical protein